MAGIDGHELELGFRGSIRNGQMSITEASGARIEFELADPELQQRIGEWMTNIAAAYSKQMVEFFVAAEAGE
ncbi:hypothetical protein [Clavibacter nebraskensis]|uniref:hypothetical protein n=1 Tax=Clavibacter nebraskensis TaxID=31963 RepID=UPI003F4C254A